MCLIDQMQRRQSALGRPRSTLFSLLPCPQIERKLTKVKEMAVAKGRWHAHGAHAEDDNFKQFKDEVSCPGGLGDVRMI